MDRRFLFPAIAATAWAQQVSPGAAEAEKAVRARAEQFYQLEVAKNFRAAWALVAEDTKDYFFDSGRPDLQSVVIDKVELSDNNTRALVTVKVKRMMIVPGMVGQVFEFPGVSAWKFENGDWFWYVDQSAGLDTPFGKIKPSGATGGKVPSLPGIPDLASLKNQITIDRTAVTLSDATPVQTVTIANHLPGPVTIEIQGIDGLIVDSENKQLGAQQTATISFHAKPGSKPTGTVGINVNPLGQHFDVAVSSK
jgi:hypothetical protein